MKNHITHHTFELLGIHNNRRIKSISDKGMAKLIGSYNRPLKMSDRIELAVLPLTPDFFSESSGLEAARKSAWEAIKAAPNLVWIITTKHPENINKFLPPDWNKGYENVCIGIMLDEHGTIDEKLEQLRKVRAAFRMIHVAPNVDPDRLVGKLAGISWIISSASGSSNIDNIIAACREVSVACLTLERQSHDDTLPEHPFGDNIVLRRPMLKGLAATPRSPLIDVPISTVDAQVSTVTDFPVTEPSISTPESSDPQDPGIHAAPPAAELANRESVSSEDAKDAPPPKAKPNVPPVKAKPKNKKQVPPRVIADQFSFDFNQDGMVPATPEATPSSEVETIDATVMAPDEPCPDFAVRAEARDVMILSSTGVTPAGDGDKVMSMTLIEQPMALKVYNKSDEFSQLVQIVRDGIEELKKAEQTFIRVGTALRQIRNRALWKTSEHKSWATYCSKCFSITKAYANRLIAAADIVEQLSQMVQVAPIGVTYVLPLSESQCRPLYVIKDAESLYAAWSRAVELAQGDQPIANVVKKAVAEINRGGPMQLGTPPLTTSSANRIPTESHESEKIATVFCNLIAAVDKESPMPVIKELCIELGKALNLPLRAA